MKRYALSLCIGLGLSVGSLAEESDRHYLTLDQAVQTEGSIQARQDLSVMGQHKISVGGFTYDRGLGVHADSKLVFPLKGRFGSFHVVPGPDDAQHGAVEMKILLDGKEVFTTGIARSADYVAPDLDIPVTGVVELTLIVTDADGNKGGDHASWADAYLLPAGYVAKQDNSPLVAHWGFEEDTPGQTLDLARKKRDLISGFTTRAEGVSGQALKFDGFTSKVVRKAAGVPSLENGFSFEAWIAPQVYPWNWAAILNQETNHQAGWFFGMGGEGAIGLHIAKDGKWIECNSKSRLPLLTWSHVAGSYDPAFGLKVYINGKLENEVSTTGAITPASDVDLWLGQSHTKTYPIRTERKFSMTFLSPMVFDGLIDEVKIYRLAMGADEVAGAFASVQPKVAQPLHYRVLPSGPEGQAKEFGAVYTRLRYAPEWEHHWRVGEDCDILVRFDESPSRIVFWRGMNYSASYVTENGLWSGDQSLEVNSVEKGCFEHMSDKQCRYCSAKIVENSDARVVVQTRYACVGIDGSFHGGDPDTGWAIWTDENYTIYPDGVTVRHMVAVNHGGGGQWQETILFNQPGARPEDTVEIEALTLANIEGESHTYSWENGPPIKWSPKPEERMFPKPSGANIQMMNLRSQWKPYIIFEPNTPIESFGIPPSLDYSKFPCWNHWPVAQIPNDGRKVIVSDRPSSFTLANAKVKIHRDENGANLTMLYGMTEQPAVSLAPLSKSWNSAPAATLKGSGFEGGTHDKSHRAYVFTRTDDKAGALEFTLDANEDSPVYHPAFVVRNWGKQGATLTIDGQAIPRGKDFRFGHHKTVDGTDLVVWVKVQKSQKTNFKLAAAE